MNFDKTRCFIKGFAYGKEFNNTLNALNAGKMLHDGQTRKSGEPYFSHPIAVAAYLISQKIHNDDILATSLLHDVLEDCNITPNALESDYKISRRVIVNVETLTKIQGISTEVYYNKISANPQCALVKIADRCHNLSTMAGVFTNEKIEKYIIETEKFVLPLCINTRNYFPEYLDQIYIMKHQIESNLGLAKMFLKTIAEKEQNFE